MSFIFLAVAVVATGASMYQSNKAQKDQERQANLDNARERSRALARARVARASSENAAALSGGAGSSGSLAAMSSISSKTATAIGNQQQMVAMGNRINRRIAQGEVYGQVASMAGQFYTPSTKGAGTSVKPNNVPVSGNTNGGWIGPRP